MSLAGPSGRALFAAARVVSAELELRGNHEDGVFLPDRARARGRVERRTNPPDLSLERRRISLLDPRHLGQLLQKRARAIHRQGAAQNDQGRRAYNGTGAGLPAPRETPVGRRNDKRCDPWAPELGRGFGSAAILLSLEEETAMLRREVGRLVDGLYGSARNLQNNALADKRLRSAYATDRTESWSIEVACMRFPEIDYRSHPAYAPFRSGVRYDESSSRTGFAKSTRSARIFAPMPRRASRQRRTHWRA